MDFYFTLLCRSFAVCYCCGGKGKKKISCESGEI
jgi:hypothetical protein